MADLIGFIPRYGKSEDLDTVSKKDGQFIITTDNKKIYLDYAGRRTLIAEAKAPQDLYTGIFEAANWEQDPESQIYIQEVEINGISGDFPLIVDLIVSESPEIAENEQEDWVKITKIIAKKDAIVGYCYNSVPSYNLSFQAKEV